MSRDDFYPVEIKLASSNGYFTPAQSNNYYAARYAREGITVHWWGDGTGADNHDNIVNYMNAQSAQGVKSVNYVLSDNKITLCVSPDNVAFASQGGNPTTISVETQPTLGAEGYKKWGWLVDQLQQRYGHTLTLYPHSKWVQTACPGSIDINRIRAEADKWARGEYDQQATPAPAPQPVPQPEPTPAPPAPLFTVQPISPKQVIVKPNRTKWNLAQPTLKDIIANPITKVGSNTVFTAVAILHYIQTGSQYYLEDANTPHGFNVVDCDDYVPPAPQQLPTAPVTAGNSEQYQVIKPISGYATSNRAINHDTPTADVAIGSYFVFNKRFDTTDKTKVLALNVTTQQQKPGAWINPLDNVETPPEPEPTPEAPAPSNWEPVRGESPEPAPTPELPPAEADWRTTFKPFRNQHGEAEIRRYIAMREVTFMDLEAKLPNITLKYPQEVNMSGTFLKGNVTYLRPKKMSDQFLWFGAREVEEDGTVNLELYSDVYGTDTTKDEREVMGTKRLSDYFWDVVDFFVDQYKKLFRKG